MTTTAKMRELTFSFRERLVLVPVELVHALKTLCIIGTIMFLAADYLKGPAAGVAMLIAYGGASLTGILIAPLLLPWLPGRSFAAKGAQAGLGWSFLLFMLADGKEWSLPVIVAAFLALPAVSAFYMLNFTGCTTFTSRSGVKKEMRLALPVIAGSIFISIILLLSGCLL
jgi:acetyl-CoA decarbonylase/synthase complex subunit gamma